MTNTKHTKRALLASVLSLLLCISMLVGSTFAWFTDSASTGVNMIQSGKLDVVLEMQDENGNWIPAEGETLEFVKGDMAAEGEAVLWEPGCTYNLPKLRISNAGNLALKFDVVITGIDGDAKLNEVIDWTYSYTSDMAVGADSSVLSEVQINKHGNGYPLLPADKADQVYNISYAYLSISGHMQETAGNEYQGLTIDGITITVLATQYTYESDSNNPMYDIGAEFPRGVTVSTEEDLAEALAVGGPVVLEKDIVVDGNSIPVSTGMPTTIDLNGKTIKVEGSGSAATDRLFYTQPGSDLVITGDGTIDFGDSISSIAVGGYGNITIENGTFIRNRYENADEFYPLIENTKNAPVGTKFVINGGYFDSGYYNLKADGAPDCFNNCRQLINSTWSNCDIVVYGGTFVGANPAWGDEGMAALCTVCGGNIHGDNPYCQQTFLDGQVFTDTELPAGYTITESALEDGRPVFTVTYSK